MTLTRTFLVLGVAVAITTYACYNFAQIPSELHESDILFVEYVQRKLVRILVSIIKAFVYILFNLEDGTFL